MNRLIISLLTSLFLILNVQTAVAVIGVESIDNEISKIEISKKEIKKNDRQLKRSTKKQKRIEKRLKKFQKKWELKNGKKKRFFGGITDEPKFQLGIILFAAGLVARLLRFLPLVGWVSGLLAGTLVTVGVILMLWTLLEDL